MNDNKVCRHEYVRIYQRRLKGLERRLVATKAYLPVGFKLGDFNYLSEGSFCFCVSCRQRLFPKRTEQERELARIERKRAKDASEAEANLIAAGIHAAANKGALDEGEGGFDDYYDESERVASVDELESGDLDELDIDKVAIAEEDGDSEKLGIDVSVEELEVESVDVADIKAEGVKIGDVDDFEEPCELDESVES